LPLLFSFLWLLFLLVIGTLENYEFVGKNISRKAAYNMLRRSHIEDQGDRN
jgi:hypothetical protein